MEGYCIECRSKYKLREEYTNNHRCPYCLVVSLEKEIAKLKAREEELLFFLKVAREDAADKRLF